MKIRTLSTAIISALGLSMATTTAFAGPSDTQTFSIQIDSVCEITVSGNPAPLIIGADSTVGTDPLDQVTDGSTTYNVTTNDCNKITAALTGDESKGSLAVTLASGLGTSAGPQPLNSTTAVGVVTGIANGAESAQTITYTYDADASEGMLSSESMTVTFTITN